MTNKREEIQQAALDATAGLRRRGIGASMGVGKTLIGLLDMDREYKSGARKFLVAAPKKSIIQSWKEEAAKFKLEYLLDYITFTTYRSLEKQSRDFDVFYADECHSLLYTHKFWLQTYPGKIFGLTGTPPRNAYSEKGQMVDNYCPIVYSYVTDEAVDDDIINDYQVILHSVALSSDRSFYVKTKTGGFTTSEKDHYLYWCKRVDQVVHPKEKQMMRIMRMQGLMQYSSKEIYVKNMAERLSEKCIVFCNTTDQADRIATHSYHSKNPLSEVNLQQFKAGDIKLLSCVQQLSEGVNIPNLKIGIILHAYSNERKSSQRLGRMLRLSPDQTAIIHILYYKDTVDEEWVKSALSDLDQSKIININDIV